MASPDLPVAERTRIYGATWAFHEGPGAMHVFARTVGGVGAAVAFLPREPLSGNPFRVATPGAINEQRRLARAILLDAMGPAKHRPTDLPNDVVTDFAAHVVAPAIDRVRTERQTLLLDSNEARPYLDHCVAQQSELPEQGREIDEH